MFRVPVGNLKSKISSWSLPQLLLIIALLLLLINFIINSQYIYYILF